MRYVPIVALLACLASSGLGTEPVGSSPPEQFSSASAIRSWVQANKGFGAPSTAEFEYPGLRVFVAWNSPFSGPASTFVYSYVFKTASGRWHRLDTSFFAQPEFLTYAYVDPTARALVYVSASGSVLRSIPLVAHWNQ